MPSNRSGTGRTFREIADARKAAEQEAAGREVVGAYLPVNESLQRPFIETNSKGTAIETKKDHCRKLQTIITWFKENRPDYAVVGIVPLAEDELNDPAKYYYNLKEDLVYEKMNVAMFCELFGALKKKKNGKFGLRGQKDLGKFKNAIEYGAAQRAATIPNEFYTYINRFLDNYKREFTQMKKDGKTDEQEADVLEFDLYKLLTQWALQAGNVFVWCFTVLQWNNMARAINIGPLKLEWFEKRSDAVTLKFDWTKADQEGAKVSPKHNFANPLLPHICPFTALGVFIAIQHERIAKTGSLFANSDTKRGAASSRYGKQLAALYKVHFDEARRFVNPDRMTPHGTRKGSAVRGTSGTTAPPPMPSLANRGEWSQGAIFNVYLQFAEAGDQYLGRILAGFDPLDFDSFDILPPHFTAPSSDPRIKEAMRICFGDIPVNFPGTYAVLELFLASVVYALDEIREKYIDGNPGTELAALPLLRFPKLAGELKTLVTTNGEFSGMTATGIPPHVVIGRDQRKFKKKVTEQLETIYDAMKDFKEGMTEAVDAAIERGDRSHGIMTQSLLEEKLERFKVELLDGLKSQSQASKPNYSMASSSPSTSANATLPKGYYTYYHAGVGKHFHTPPGWTVPRKCNLKNAWSYWLMGDPTFRTKRGEEFVDTPVGPFRLLVEERGWFREVQT